MATLVILLSWHASAALRDSSTNTILGAGDPLRFKCADNDTNDNTFPIPLPTSGFSYSYPKNLQLNVQNNPPTQVGNISIYPQAASSLGTGIDMMVKTSPTYVDPTVTRTSPVTGTVSLFTYNATSRLTVPGTLYHSSVGPFGDFIVMQMRVAPGATLGPTGTNTVVWAFDES